MALFVDPGVKLRICLRGGLQVAARAIA